MRDFVLPTAVTNAFGWGSGQADRLVVTFLAGPGPLGLLSIALAAANFATDAVLARIINASAVQDRRRENGAERAAAFSTVLLRPLLIAAAL